MPLTRVFFGLAIVLIASCTTAPVVEPPVEVRPDWVESAPSLAAAELVAFGAGSSPERAAQALIDDLRRQIERRLAAEIDEGLFALDEGGGEFLRTVEARLEAELARELDRWQSVRDGEVELFARYRYTETERLVDAAGFADAVNRRDAALNEAGPPEAEGATPLDRVRRALENRPEAPGARAERLEEALAAASQLVFTSTPSSQQVPLGGRRPDPLTFTMTTIEGVPVGSGQPMAAAVRAPNVPGAPADTRTVGELDEDARLTVALPLPELSGRYTVRVEPLWLDDVRAAWESEPGAFDAIASRLTSVATIDITSRADEIPTVLVLADRDIAGNVIGSSDTLRGAVQEFNAAGFRVRQADLERSARARLADPTALTIDDIYSILPFDVLSSADRAIVGAGRIVEFTEGGSLIARVQVRAVAWDLRRDLLLADVEVEERISGSDTRTILRTAFQAAGRRLARTIAPRLP